MIYIGGYIMKMTSSFLNSASLAVMSMGMFLACLILQSVGTMSLLMAIFAVLSVASLILNMILAIDAFMDMREESRENVVVFKASDVQMRKIS